MELQGKTVLVTGANRGIGASLVRAFLNHNVAKVYAAARNPSALPKFNDPRVVPLKLDITKPADVAAAAEDAGHVDILVNNAGVANGGQILTVSAADLTGDMDVNYYGTVRMMQAFAPLFEKRGNGVIANVISVVGLASLPGLGGYSATKAALFSATQAARAALKGKNVQVVGIYPGPIDTDLARNLTLDKASPADTAEDIVAGLMAGQDEIYPDPTSKQLSGLWASNPKGLEQFFAGL
jgi:NAD(P)-dependent dehydrogenase (short-subunit alcohol dehydrogenase family)